MENHQAREIPLDWTKCPCCGEVTVFGVHSDERLYGQCPVTLHRGEAGEIEANFFGVTDIYWDTTTTVGYFADCCGQSLPDAYQDELDRLLSVTRVQDPNWHSTDMLPAEVNEIRLNDQMAAEYRPGIWFKPDPVIFAPGDEPPY